MMTLAGALACVSPCPADSGTRPQDDASRVRVAVEQGKVLPLPRILAVAQQRVHGDILKVELQEIGNRVGYQVKMLTPDGRVREIQIDAQSGRVVRVQND